MEDAIDEKKDANAMLDFQLGEALREQVIPRAVLYYTGEVEDDEDGGIADRDEDAEDERAVHGEAQRDDDGEGQ